MRVDKIEAYGRVRPAAEQGGRNLLEASGGVETWSAAAGQTKSEALRLMEAVVERGNMLCAYERVLKNKGAPGVDGRTVSELKDWLKTNWLQVRQALLSGDYMPLAVRKVEIPKPNGGVRTLGIPTVVDRLIQQGLHQVLQPIFEPPYAEPHVRWCGRTARVISLPTRCSFLD
jgi:RNA-directed DNA polymerase